MSKIDGDKRGMAIAGLVLACKNQRLTWARHALRYINELKADNEVLTEACMKANTCASLPDDVRKLCRDAVAKAERWAK